MRYLAKISDRGDKRYIFDLCVQSENNYFDSRKYIPITAEVYAELVPRLEKLNKEYGTQFILYVSKEDNSIQKISQVKSDEDDADIKYKSFSEYKYTVLGKAADIMMQRTKMYPYKQNRRFKYNQILMSRGFFISDENREEKYLEIVSTEDDNLIEIFLKYLDAHDWLAKEDTVMDMYEGFEREIETCRTKEEVDALFLKYFSNYVS